MEFTEKYLFDQQTTIPSLFLLALPIYFFPDLTNVFYNTYNLYNYRRDQKRNLIIFRSLKTSLPSAARKVISSSCGALGDLCELVAADRRQLRNDAHRGVVLAQRHA
jgi:hypothetical protein